MNTEGGSWRTYERFVAALIAANEGVEVSITPNARIVGCISGKSRQVDALIDTRWGDDLSRRVIVDAKKYAAKIDIKDVESFEGMMRDCQAQRGVLICPNGYTDGAKRRSQDAITIQIVTLEELQDENYIAAFEECYGRCSCKEKPKQKGLVLWDAVHALEIGGLYAIVHTGKCDVCHCFQVWCWDCGAKFSLPIEDEHTCSCGRTWVSAIEEEIEDETGRTLNAVHLLVVDETGWAALDRRMLR